MKPLDPDALAAAMIGGARKYIDAAMVPVLERLAAAEGRADAAEATIAAMVEKAVAAIPAPEPGKSFTAEDCQPLIDAAVTEAVKAIPRASDGVGISDAMVDADGRLVLVLDNGATKVLSRVIGPPVAGEEVEALVARAVAALPAAEPGKPGEVDMDAVGALVRDAVTEAVAEIPVPVIPDVLAMVRDAVGALPKPADGKDADMAAVADMVGAAVDRAVAAIPAAQDGKSVTVDDVAPLIAAEVSKAVAALPEPKDGTSITADDVAPMIASEVSKAVAAIPVPKDGAPGKLGIVKAWADTVHREADVVTHEGATYQAVRDTGKAPPHADWICLAARGDDGKPADQIEVKGTYDPDAAYGRLDVVALNGGAFISRKVDPGPCPGEGWQVIAMRGKEGRPGEGRKGDSVKGDPGDPVVEMTIDDQGLLTLVNGDGSAVQCDLYPVLRKVQG